MDSCDEGTLRQLLVYPSGFDLLPRTVGMNHLFTLCFAQPSGDFSHLVVIRANVPIDQQA